MDPQKKAIETINRNVAVNAGAGTGKTKVLTERFVYILENGDLEINKEVESIVAITFTKKATQEMVERIRNEIKKNFYKSDKWIKFYRDMEKSNISTIHSFCGKLLRENPIEAKIDPLFEVLDEITSKNLLNESISEAMDLDLHTELLDFLLLLKEFRLNSIVGDIRNVYNLVRTVGLSFEEVKTITLNFLDGLKIDSNDIDIIIDTISYLQGKLTKASNLVKLVDNPKWIKLRNKTYNENELFEILEFIMDRMGTSKKEEEKFELLKTTISRVLLVKEALSKNMYTSFLNMLILADNLYRLKKDQLGGLDYDDLQIMCLKLLDNKEILSKYQDKYRYIMIDEFQDTNQLQRSIFYKLATKDSALDMQNLFVVGDPKQSIYAFRGADIDVFYDVLNDIEKTTGQKPITLSDNYRTVDTVLDFINDVFEKLMGSAYDSLNPMHKSENKIDINILEDSNFESGTEDATIYEANLIAKRIRQLVDMGVYKYKDFALLFRATTRNFYYEQALKKFSIPYYNSSSKQFFNRQEILDVLNALKTISNPFDTISTIGFLRGPMIGLSDETIFWLLNNVDTNLYHTIHKNFNEAGFDFKDEEESKLNIAKSILDYFYSIKDISSISYIMDKLLDKTYFIEAHLLKNDGKQSMANIYKFIDIVNKYEETNMQSLEDFIDYIEAQREEVESEGVIESEDSDVVKLLTIHKSKGLQFPVVIVPEMAKDFMNTHNRILFSKDIGIGIKTDENKGIYDLIKMDLNKREVEERKRVLYVAMTRAKNMLILGNQGKSKGFKKMTQELLNPDYLSIIDDIDIEREELSPIKLIDMPNAPIGLDTQMPLLNLKPIDNKPFERYSISQFLNFKSCRRSFYFNYLKHIHLDEELIQDHDYEEEIVHNGLSAIDKGNVIHKFCELYDSKLNKEELIKEIAISLGLELDSSQYSELLIYADNYINYNDKQNAAKIYKEKPFYIGLGQSYLYGIIDRINISGDEVSIVDYKTNRLTNKNSLINHYKNQLVFYAYVVEKILKKKVGKASLLFLESGEEVQIDISSDAKDRIVEEIVDFMDFVEKNSSIEDYSAADHCNDYCKHKSLCNIFKTDQIL